MRVGVLGGTFDPVHVGHLILAEQCREQARLDEVRFIPAARPPHKQQDAVTSFEHRVEMLSLAIAGHAAFRIDTLEKDRSGPSYTADTLQDLHARHSDAELYLILGSDCLPDLVHWHEPARIMQLAAFLLVERRGWPIWQNDQLCAALALAANTDVRQQIVQMPLIEISSRDVRARVAAARSIRYLVPRAVECYIDQHRLYV
jgi:nicotinate-nucleotide adenylyltransferase